MYHTTGEKRMLEKELKVQGTQIFFTKINIEKLYISKKKLVDKRSLNNFSVK